jgi:ABC-type cobalamin transport system ATPase subunit
MTFISGIVSFALQIWATAGIAFKRLLTQRFLSLASIAGLMIASGFILSVPLYADATYFRLLREEILVDRELELTQKPVDYAPLAFVFELKAAGKDSPQWKNVTAVDEYLSNTALPSIGFQQQRVAIARALANHAQLLLADEPTGELDSKTTRELLTFFRELIETQHITMLMVSHDPLVDQYVHQVLTLTDGVIENHSRSRETPGL